MNAIDRYKPLHNNPEEYQKCLDNPVYFYNTYIKHPDDPDVDEAQYNEIKAKFERIREGTIIGKRRNPFLEQCPLRPNECFNDLKAGKK